MRLLENEEHGVQITPQCYALNGVALAVIYQRFRKLIKAPGDMESQETLRTLFSGHHSSVEASNSVDVSNFKHLSRTLAAWQKNG